MNPVSLSFDPFPRLEIGQFVSDLDAEHMREGYWGMCASEEKAARWARFYAEQADAPDRMRAEGIDPNAVSQPRGHKGKWPRFEA